MTDGYACLTCGHLQPDAPYRQPTLDPDVIRARCGACAEHRYLTVVEDVPGKPATAAPLQSSSGPARVGPAALQQSDGGLSEGRRLRDAGMDRVNDATALSPKSDYRRAFAAWVRGRAPGDTYTSEAIIDAVGLPPGDGRMVGALMMALERQGWHKPTERYVQTSRAVRHGGVSRVWRRVDSDA